MKTGLLERLNTDGVICAEGYLTAGEFVPEVALDNPDALRILHQDFQLKFEYLEPGGQGANIRKSAAVWRRCIYERLPKPWAANRRPAGLRKICTSISCMVTA